MKIEKFIESIPQIAGIYYFQADFRNVYKKWCGDSDNLKSQRDTFITTLIDKWDNSSNGKSPKIYKDICKRKTNLREKRNELSDEWVAFYIGKHQDLHYRIKEHIWGNNCSGTYSLRLIDRYKM